MAYINFDPQDYFNTKLYTGNGSSGNAQTGIGFQPDWVWIKDRGQIAGHQIFDSVRGVTKRIQSNSTGAEVTNDGVSSFDNDGFTLGANSSCNENSQNFVAWNWLGGGTGASNTDGSITSTVSANTTAGFSIVKWTANLSNAVTVGHGLGTTPKVLIQKAIDQTSGWIVSGFGLDWSGYLPLESTGAFNNDSDDTNGTGRFFSAGGTEPNSTIFSTKSSALVGSASDVIAYCFAEKKGFSKFNSYVGNGNADGPFIYTGFKPAFVMYKRTDASGYYFSMWDNKRDSFNLVDLGLNATTTAAEYTETFGDFVSNGFKIRGTNTNKNEAGGTYVYMAFAENPLVNSLGNSATAR